MKASIILYVLLLLMFSHFAEAQIISADSVPLQEKPSERLSWLNTKPLNTLGLIFSLSPLINKTAGFHIGLQGTWEYYKLENKAFKTVISGEGQLFSYAGNTYARNTYTDAFGKVYKNEEEFRPWGLNLSVIPEIYFTKAYPLYIGVGIGPSFSLEELRRTREFRYYNGSENPSLVKYRTFE